MKKAIFITARLGSSRLPRKHLLEIEGEHCIEHVIRNAKRAKKADIIVLCTTELEEDLALCRLAEKHKIKYFRGSVLDKLERWNRACKKYKVDFFVTADADDLFCSPELMDMAFGQHERTKADFIEGEEEIISGAFTYGISAKSLKEVCEIKGTTDTEMMWLYFTDSGLFQVETLLGVPEKYKRKDIRMTLDYIEDYEFFKTTIEGLYREGKKEYSFDDILLFFDKRSEIAKINIERNNDWKNNQNQKVGLVYKDGYISNSVFSNLNNLALKKNKNDEEFYYQYFQGKIIERISFIEKLKKMVRLDDKSFLSIACGVAAEESLLVGSVNELVLLDSSVEQMRFVKNIYKERNLLNTKTKIKFVSNTMQHFKPQKQFDIVYISGPSDWMCDKDNWYKVPEDYSNFLKDYLKESGVLLLRIYGPYAQMVEMQKEDYSLFMFDGLERGGFKDVQMFVNTPLRMTLFVASKSMMDFEIENLDSDLVP